MKTPTDFRKTVETGVDPRLMSPSMLASPAGVFREEYELPYKRLRGRLQVCQTFEFFHLQIVLKWEAKKRKKRIKGNSWSRKSLEKPLVFIVVSAENVGEITYSKSCRVGFAPLPVANGYVRKIMLAGCYVITISKSLWLISFPINYIPFSTTDFYCKEIHSKTTVT